MHLAFCVAKFANPAFKGSLVQRTTENLSFPELISLALALF